VLNQVSVLTTSWVYDITDYMHVSKAAKTTATLAIRIIQSKDVFFELALPVDVDPGTALHKIRSKLIPIPAGTHLGYKFSGDPVRSPAHVLTSSDDMAGAISALLGKMKRSRGANKFLAVEVVVSYFVVYVLTSLS
jgi:hypothetical protein